MGKKSRLKREKKQSKSNSPSLFLNQNKKANNAISNFDFEKKVMDLRDYLYRYNAEDVCASINISELWLPNISSQVKHYFAMSVFLSSEAQMFNEESRIKSYEEFRVFIEGLYDLLPSYTMYEDYVPELDWGEVKTESQKKYLRIFYGGAIECISDYLDTFKILFENSGIPELKNAYQDLHNALVIQNYLLTSVDRNLLPEDISITPGHIEAPGKGFWSDCRKALVVLSTDENYWNFSKPLTHQLGDYKIPKTQSSFIDGMFSSPYLDGIAVTIGEKTFALSLRNSTSVILDYWGAILEKRPYTFTDVFHKNFRNFLNKRFDEEMFVVGPSRFSTPNKTYEPEFFCTFFSGHKVYLFIAYDINIEDQLLQIEETFMKLSETGGKWGMRGPVNHFVFEINVDPKDVEIILVIPKITTTTGMSFPIDHFRGRVIGLRELIGILDSVENRKEFEDFWEYYDESSDLLLPMTGMMDIFGSFRDSHNVLIDGAISFDSIFIDPHWGSNWRFNELRDFWIKAPETFPEYSNVSWKIDKNENGSSTLISKNGSTLAKYVQIETCSVFFSLEVDTKVLDLLNGRILELVIDCLTDSCTRRAHLISNSLIFEKSRIVTEIKADSNFYLEETRDSSEEDSKWPLFSSWRIEESDGATIRLITYVNLQRVQFYLTEPKNSYFEANVLTEWIKGASEALQLKVAPKIISDIKLTEAQKPRFTLTRHERIVDAPDFGTEYIPQPVQYKLARKDMAIAFKDIGAEPGRYELNDAKNIIDKARDAYRIKLHGRIAEFNRNHLLHFCIEQIDIQLSTYQRKSIRVRLSMKHEVDYDRANRLADLHEEHIRNSKNYRYLLEAVLSAAESGQSTVTQQDVLELIASVDWLFVMYGASDVLHNEIEVGGVEIDNTFIPEVFYSANRKAQDDIFGLEAARYRLGIDLNPSDEVSTIIDGDVSWDALDAAFLKDIGFSFTNLCSFFVMLSKWPSVNDSNELNFTYRARRSDLAKKLIESFDDLSIEEANKIVEFAILNPLNVRKLEGKHEEESDVPTWEHNKRTSRLTIRPLVPIEDHIAWGPTMAHKSYEIWRNALSEGYLPADYQWENVKKVIRTVKESIEKNLEVKTHEIALRSTKYAMHGIDFKRRFPKENFADVGDYDVLAYWPDHNLWLSFEAKYNQPPFCLKDGRRLRERIFGIDKNRGQFKKIELRRDFLKSNLEKIRTLLNWPIPQSITPLKLHDVYISRNIYWWMRNPPYGVPTDFIRIDGLDSWLKSYLIKNNLQKD